MIAYLILIFCLYREYPEFYTKLYSMLEPDILLVKFRAKFFFWTDIFMSSTHLPAYLVAAFIKRASRIALTAPIDALVILIPFIGNMLIRHQSLLDTLVNSDHSKGLSKDPFNNTEPDPVKTLAIESSLWELKTLQNHWHPKISSAASFINKQLPTMEFDLSDLLETTFDEMLEETMELEVKLIKDTVDVDTKVADEISHTLFGHLATL